MIPENWLIKDDFIWRELLKASLSIVISLALILLGRKFLFRRDRRVRELDRSRDVLDELRKELVEIDNEYYKVRKRYATVRDAFLGNTRRNPYIVKLPARREEVMDDLLVTCIGLEARYYTLMKRLEVSLPVLWSNNLKSLMERDEKEEEDNLEYCFDKIRDCIEKQTEIDKDLKTPIAAKFELILAAFDNYEPKLLVYSPKELRQQNKGKPHQIKPQKG